MDSQIEEIKSKIDIADFISQYFKLTRAGRNFKGLCPFHSERTPSFMVSPERGTWRCFGCGEHGDVITFLEKYENLTFIEALEQLAKRAGVTLTKHQNRDEGQQKRKDRLYELLNLSAEFYHYLLTNHKLGEAAKQYTQNRQITEETVKSYLLGYAPNSWHSLSSFLNKKGYSDQELIASGMASPGRKGAYDRFRGRLMFPVFDNMGRVVGFSGRIMDPSEKAAKYLNNPDSDLFHKGKLLYGLLQAKDAIRKNDRIVLVEGNVDVLASAQAGVPEVVAPLGTALTPEQISLIKRFTNNIYIAFDQDNAGVEAVKRSIELLKQAELNIKIVEIIDGSDPDDCIKRNPKNWHRSLKQAKDVFDYYLSWASQNFDLSTELGKIKASQQILPLISATNSKVAQAFLIQKTANALTLSEEAIRAEMKNAPATQTPAQLTQPTPSRPKTPPVKTRAEIVSEYLIIQTIHLLANQAPLKDVQRVLQQLDINSLASHHNIAKAIVAEISEHSTYDSNRLTQKLEASDKEEFDRLNLIPTTSELTEAGKISHSIEEQLTDLRHAIREVHQLHIRGQLNTISRSLKQAELLDKKQVTELQQQFLNLSQELAKIQSERDSL